MKRALILLLLLVALGSGAASTQQAANSRGTRLVLLIAVDQFRYDYLTRFRAEYQSGLKKMLDRGAVFTDANLEHYPTVTAVGHATMLSGAIPAVSGIVGNDWFDRETGKNVTSVADLSVSPVGSPSAVAASPHRMLVSTLGDELKLLSAAPKGSPASPRVIGVSLKDRSAILPVGRAADAAYWLDTRSGSFVTSTYYMADAPAWVREFNQKRVFDTLVGKSWTPIAPPAAVLREFPKEVGPGLYDAAYASPYGNDLLLEFALQALAHEQLGQRGPIDVLSVSFSSNDSVGHTFGPDSPHVRDIAIRTDRVIGQLLDRVDKVVGLHRTLIALTSDHGVAPLPETVTQHSLPGGRMTSKELFGPIEQALAARFGSGQWVAGTAGSSPYLNYALISQLGLDPAHVRDVAAGAAMAVPHVARVYTRDQLLRGQVPNDRIGQRVLRGFNAQRSGDLEIILEPFWMRQAQGTTHGSPYNYDAHIPLVLMGPGIQPGVYSSHVALNDLAPTLSTLLDLAPPSASSGRVLTEAIVREARPVSRTHPGVQP